MDRAKQLGEERIATLLVKFSVPAIIGMMVQALYNIVDRIFIGNGVGTLGIAGATVCFPFMLIFMAFGMLIGLGGSASVSIALGQHRKEFAEKILGNSFLLLFAVGVVLTIAGLVFMEPLLRLFGASDAILPYSSAYLRIILYGVVVNGMAFGLNNFIRGEGSPRTAMGTMLIGAALNTILDPIFIFGFGMGIRGAAWATIISQAAAAAWIFGYYFGGKSMLKIRLRNLRLDKDVVARIIAVGSAPFAMQLAASVMNSIMNRQLLSYGGDIAISVMGIVGSVAMLILMPMFGLNQGAQPIIGYNFGAGQYGRLKKAIGLTIAAATATATLGWAATRLFPRGLIRLFNSRSGDLAQVGALGMLTVFAVFPLVGFQVAAAGYFQAVGKPRQAMLVSLSRQVLFLIPLLFILPPVFGLTGVFAAAPAADFLSVLVTGGLFFRELSRLKKIGTENGGGA